jgi:hypothetical protein
MSRRTNLHSGKDSKKRIYSGKYALSGIVYCGICSEIYRRVYWYKRGCKIAVWRCVSKLEEKGSDCSSPTINDETLQNAVVRAINEVIGSREEFLLVLQENINTVLSEEYDKNTVEIDKRMDELQKEMLKLAMSKSDYNTVADEIYRLRELKQNILTDSAERQGKRQRIAELEEFLSEQEYKMEVYDELLVRKLIEKVTVFEDKLTIKLKSCIEINVEI